MSFDLTFNYSKVLYNPSPKILPVLLKGRGKQFVSNFKTRFMWSEFIINNANEFCFAAAVLISVLFYRQYKKYEEEAEREEMIEKFLR